MKFTNDQQQAVDGIISFINDDFNPTKFIVGLTGVGGTGKTFITKYIIDNCNIVPSCIKCISPTHKACRVFANAIRQDRVHTVHSTFGLRMDMALEDFDPFNPKFSPIAQPKLENILLLIIDEASMIPAKLVTYICNVCKENDIKIIFIGDNHQLAPVNELKSIAFNRCYKVFELKEIVRQSSVNPISKLLELLCYDVEHQTYRFLSYVSKNIGMTNYNEIGEGFSICNPRDFNKLINTAFLNKEYTKNIDMYRIIAYTNNCVTGWNNYIRNAIIKDSDKAIITKNDLIMSYTTITDEFMSTIINNSEEYVVHDIIDYVDDKYGFKGFMVKFQLVHGGSLTKPLFIINYKDPYTLAKYYKTLNNLIDIAKKSTKLNKAQNWKNYYTFKRNYLLMTNIVDRNTKSIIFTRDIDYGFAITSHKSQGSTYETVFVDLNDMVFDKNGVPCSNQNELLRRLYVACSRAHKELVLCFGK